MLFQVLIRYGLQVLFYDVLSITSDKTIIYRDLPANMVCDTQFYLLLLYLKKNSKGTKNLEPIPLSSLIFYVS